MCFFQVIALMMVGFHCIAHREAPAVSQATTTVAYLMRMESIICLCFFSKYSKLILKYSYKHSVQMQFYFLTYGRSSTRYDRLNAILAMLQMKSVRLKKVFDIRWLSMKEAVEAVVKLYLALTVFLPKKLRITETHLVLQGYTNISQITGGTDVYS